MTEQLLDALLDRLRDRFPSLLDQVWAERESADDARGEVVPFVEPKLYLYGRRMQDPIEHPAVMLWQEGTDFEETGSTQGAGADTASGWTVVAHTLVVAVTLASDDEAVLERMLARYRTALLRFLVGHQIVVGASAFDLQPLRMGRESAAGNLRVNTPGVRGIFCDVVARGEESF